MLKHTALLALAALPAAHADGHLSFGWVKTGDVCAGIKTTCAGVECTGVVIGKCPNGATFPTEGWIYSEFVGVGLVNANTYLTGASPSAPPSGSASSTPPVKGFRDNDLKTDPVSGNGYAYVMSGAVFGDMDTSGAYVGIASYLNTGTGALSSNENMFYVAGGSLDQAHTSRGVSNIGAPRGPYRVCVSDIDPSTGACGAARTYQPGDYKFSVFGYTSGSSFDLGESAVDGATHVVVRMKLTVPVAPHSMTFNDGAIDSLRSLGNTDYMDVKNFKFTFAAPGSGANYATCAGNVCPCLEGLSFPDNWGAGDQSPVGTQAQEAIDNAAMRDDAALASYIDCVCKRCGTYPEIQRAATAGYCTTAAAASDGSCPVPTTTLRYSFPSTYNVGSAADNVESESVLNTGTATKNVKVKISPGPEDEIAIYVDYLFEKADLAQAGKYFVYDPDVLAGSDDGDDGLGDVIDYATTAGLSVATACVLAIASLYHM